MFEAIELGEKVPKAEFEAAALELRTALLEVQRALRERQVPVVIVLAGVEGAGKSELTNRLSEWLDARGLRVETFWEDDEAQGARPAHWRYWRALPRRGQISVFFGGWYAEPIAARVSKESDAARFQLELSRVSELERLLRADGALIVKLWLHIPKDEQARRLKKRAKRWRGSGRKPAPWEQRFAKQFDAFTKVSEAAIRATDSGACPWQLIEATHKRHRDLSAGRALLDLCRRHLARLDAVADPAEAEPGGETKAKKKKKAHRTILDKVDLSLTLDGESYAKKLARAQERLAELSWRAWEQGVTSVVVFEGWDAAGKGGAIRRLVAPIDARLFKVVPIAAPSDEERAYPYLWRFWRELPRDGYLRIFDRSWYGRVLVERVEGFARPEEWRRAYREINHFEEQLADHGVALTKIWLHLSKGEQLRRFEARQATPWKRHKITEEDWRNRERWADYEVAVGEMVARTSTRYAPWTLIPGDDKRYARIEVIQTVTRGLEEALDPASGGKKKGKRR